MLSNKIVDLYYQTYVNVRENSCCKPYEKRVGRQIEKHEGIVKMWDIHVEIQNMNRIEKYRLRWHLKIFSSF